MIFRKPICPGRQNKTLQIITPLLLLCSALLCLSFSKPGNFRVKAVLKNMHGSKPVLYVYGSNGRQRVDLKTSTNGIFVFDGITDQEVTYAYLEMPSENETPGGEIEFFIAAGTTTTLAADGDHLALAQRKGGVDNDRYSNLQKQVQPLQQAYETSLEHDKAKAHALKNTINELRINYIKSNTELYSSLFTLLVLSSENGSELDEQIPALYDLLAAKYKNTYFGKRMLNKIKTLSVTKKGAAAPDFSTQTITHGPFRLSDQKGKYILLEFWGSWCIPCRKEHPLMQQLYDKYKSRGLEIVGIANENTTAAKGLETLQTAVKKDAVTWIQILNDKEQQDITGMYGIIKYPTKFLLDKEGRIMHVYVGEESQLEQDLAAIFP